jgi:hypothetical protein
MQQAVGTTRFRPLIIRHGDLPPSAKGSFNGRLLPRISAGRKRLRRLKAVRLI